MLAAFASYGFTREQIEKHIQRRIILSAMSVLIDGLVVWLVFVFGFFAGWIARVYLTEAQRGMRPLPAVRGPERRQGGHD